MPALRQLLDNDFGARSLCFPDLPMSSISIIHAHFGEPTAKEGERGDQLLSGLGVERVE